MCELSTADGFVEINESLGDMIKYIANEPSVGLYYIQQHAQNAVPNVIRLNNNVMEKSHITSLHTEDLEDSIAMTRSMKQCGFPIIDEMIRDIKSSLTIMSTKQPVRGVIQPQNSSYQKARSSSWAPVTWARGAVSVQDYGETEGSYFSNVFKSAKEKAGNLKWPQLDLKEPRETVGGVEGSSSNQLDEGDELPLSSQAEDEMVGKTQLVLSESSDYDEFKADKEARLEEWLKGSGNVSGDVEEHHHHHHDSL